jgi:hypothetical protein
MKKSKKNNFLLPVVMIVVITFAAVFLINSNHNQNEIGILKKKIGDLESDMIIEKYINKSKECSPLDVRLKCNKW